MKRP